MDVIELKDGTSIRCKALSKEDYEGLLQDGKKELLNEYEHSYGILVHKTGDNTIVVSDNGYYTLYFAREDLDKVLSDAGGGGFSSNEIMLNKNPFGKQFSNQSKVLVEELLGQLKIEQRDNDGVLLLHVDEKLATVQDWGAFKSKYFLHFIAIVGEELIRKYDAKWDMELAPDGVTWNPYLSVTGSRVTFFTYLYEDVFLREGAPKHLLSAIFHTVEDIIRYNLKK